LAVLAGVSQYLQAQFMPKPPTPAPGAVGSFTDSFSKSMNTQMKYVFPLLIIWIAYRISGAIALYWIINNMFTVGQQIYVSKTEKKVLDKEVEVLISQK
jgi:YidC/Oxa1 family membrane protein insertase